PEETKIWSMIAMLVALTSPGVFAEHRRQLLWQGAVSSKMKSAYKGRSNGIACKDRLLIEWGCL
ncbi:hypothetical protein ACC722_38425, partial [Rhizobium ruizarguesonis]